MILTIIFLFSFSNTGDSAHKDALKNTFQASCNTAHNSIKFYEIDANAQTDDLKKMYVIAETESPTKKGNHTFVFAIGEQALTVLRLLQKENIGLCSFVASVHQWFDSINDLNLDWLAIPKGAVAHNASFNAYTQTHATKVIPMFAVPCLNPTPLELQQRYEQWNCTNKPNIDGKYIIVTLPGDAPDEQNKMKLFSKASAEKLVTAVVKLWKDLGSTHTILVQNSPRTGKYNEQGKVICDHKKPKDAIDDPVVDEISSYVKSRFSEERVPFKFYNFLFETEGEKIIGNNSVFFPLFYLASRNCENRCIVPAESVSMIGQIPCYVFAKNCIYFRPDSMNDSHEALLQVALQQPYGGYFTSDGTLVPATGENVESCRSLTDADLLIKTITQDLFQEQNS